MQMVLGIGSGLLMVLISIFFTGLFLNDPVLVLLLGFAFGAIPYFVWVFPHMSVSVPADEAWLLANTFERESSAELLKFSGHREIVAQRECQAGFYWKYPWEIPSKAVDMTRQILVENKEGKTYTMQGGRTVRLKWRIFCVPLPGNIVKYIRTKPEDIERRVRDRAESFLQGYIGGLSHVNYGKDQMNQIKAEFEKLFGGPENIDDEERELGVWTGTPEIIDIDDPKEVQEALNFEREMAVNIRIANRLVKESGNRMSFERAMRSVIMNKAKGNIDYVELAGVFGPSQQGQGKKGQKKGDDDAN